MSDRLPRIVLNVVVIGGLYGLGLWGWNWFYNGGALDWTSYDWPKEQAYYLVLREALTTGRVPYHITEYFNGTNRFLGMPETNLCPQILLLPWIDVSRFIVLDLLLMYTAGFLGCLVLRRRYQLGLASFTMLAVLFLANGYIQCRMAIGHSMWLGYFLMPFFALFVLEWQERGPSVRLCLWLALVLFGMMLHGSFHLVNWCWMFLGLMIAFRPRQWPYGLLLLLTGVMLNLYRLLPGVIAFRDVEARGFLGGYQSLTHLIESFTVLHGHAYRLAGGEPVVVPLGWWEYDFYVGPVAFAALIYLGVALRFSRRPELEAFKYPGLDGPLIILTLLSIGFLHGAIASLPVPMATVERVTSRFVTVPFVMVLVIAAIRLDRLLRTVPVTPTLVVVLVCAFVETMTTLGFHGWLWRLTLLESEMHLAVYHAPEKECYSAVIDNHSDVVYVGAVWASWAVSLVALLVVLAVLWRTRPVTAALPSSNQEIDRVAKPA